MNSKLRLVPVVGLTISILASCSGGTGGASPTTTTVPPATTTTTTVVDRPQGAAQLTQAIPGPMDLPSGWTAQGSASSSLTETLKPASGLGFGLCSGPNRDELLNRYGVIAWAWSPLLTPPNGGDYAYVGIFEFPSSDDAARFIEASSMQGACGSETYEARELGEGKSQEDTPETFRIDKFGGSDNTTKWKISASYSTGAALPSSKAPGYTALTTKENLARVGGKNYGDIDQQVLAYEQYQNVVLRFSINGGCCAFGYSNTETNKDDTRPTMSLLDELANQVRIKILTSLGLDKVHE